MARRRTPAKTPGFAQIAQALLNLPDEAKRWTRAAQRETWKEYQNRSGDLGLAARFEQTAEDLGSTRPGHFAQYGLGLYGWSARRHMIPRRATHFAGHVSRRPNRPAFVHSGAMKAELMKRKARTRITGGQVRSKVSIYHRSINFWGAKRGISRMDIRKEYVTYLMTVYTGPGGAANKAGPEKVWVSRLVDQTMTQPAAQTYADEWAYKPKEIAWMITRAEALLRARVVKGVFDRKGNVKTKYRSRLAAEVAA